MVLLKKINSHKITIYAIYLAVMLIMNFVPYFGYIVVPGVLSLTLMIIPIVVATLHLGVEGAIFSWITFAILSFVSLPIRGGTTLAFFGWTSSFVALVLGRLSACTIMVIILFLIKKNKDNFLGNVYIKSCMVGFCSPILNSIFVLSFFYLCNNKLHTEYFWAYFFSYYLNMLVEIIISLVVSISVIPLIKHLSSSRGSSNTWVEK